MSRPNLVRASDSAYPLEAITGSAGRNTRITFSASSPLSTGIVMSRMISRIGSANRSTAATASRPFSATSTE